MINENESKYDHEKKLIIQRILDTARYLTDNGLGGVRFEVEIGKDFDDNTERYFDE